MIGLTVFYLRRRMEESDDFLAHQRGLAEIKAGRRPRTRHGMTAIIREYPKGFAIAFGVAVGGGVMFYTFTGYLERYLVAARGFDKDDVSLMSFAALVVFLVIQPAAGWLADRIGARRVMAIFAVGTMVSTPVVFVVIAHTSSLLVAFLSLIVGLAFLACYGGAAATLYADQFPTKVRALGMGMAHSLANAIFGGTTEMLALALKESGHEGVFPGTSSRPPGRPCWPWRSCRQSPASYLGSTSAGSMPSSSATCSTRTVRTSASRSARVSQRCSMGRRKSTSRVGWPPLPRRSDESGTVPDAQSSGICGASSTAYSTRPSRSASAARGRRRPRGRGRRTAPRRGQHRLARALGQDRRAPHAAAAPVGSARGRGGSLTAASLSPGAGGREVRSAA